MNDLLEGLFEDRRRTLPWSADEFVYVDNLPCVYSVGRKAIEVIHLHGRRQATVEELLAEGRDVVMPRRIRCGRDAGREL